MMAFGSLAPYDIRRLVVLDLEGLVAMRNPSVLITAFEPYGPWQDNASWLALVELTRHLPDLPRITTRRYPVDLELMTQQLAEDLEADHDYVLHLGQAPRRNRIELETVAVNLFEPAAASSGETDASTARPIQPEGPDAIRTHLPLDTWAEAIRAAGIPATVSYHAGTYLCNAIFYETLLLSAQRGLRTQATFVHIPLAPTQVLAATDDVPSMASMASDLVARALLTILGRIAESDA